MSVSMLDSLIDLFIFPCYTLTMDAETITGIMFDSVEPK